MAPTVVRYPLDPTGRNSSNLVQEEEHLLGVRTIRAFATHNGGFFSDSIIIKDKATQRVLEKETEYYCAEIYEIPTKKYGKEICSVVVITNPDVSDEILVTYQALGGPWSTSQQAILQLFTQIENNQVPVKWSDIIGKPTGYNPLAHLHDAGDVYGLEYIVDQMQRIIYAVTTKDRASHIEIYQYIDWLVSTVISQLGDSLGEHRLSGDHDWRYFTKDESDDIYMIKGESIGTELDGSLVIYQGVDYSWLITNYDSFSTYQVASNQGNVNISGDKVLFKMPVNDQVVNPLVLTVTRNGMPATFEITILEAGILPPNIIALTGDNVCNLLTPTIRLSNFIVIPAGTDTHYSTDMQLSDDINFSNIIWQSMGITSGPLKLEATLPKLSVNKTYYFRGRFNGTLYEHGSWNTIILNTHNQQVVKESVNRNTTYAYQYDVPTSRITSYNSVVVYNTSRLTTFQRQTTRISGPIPYYHYQGAVQHPISVQSRATLANQDNINRSTYPDWRNSPGIPNRQQIWSGYGLCHSNQGAARDYEGSAPPGVIGLSPGTASFFAFDSYAPQKKLWGWWQLRWNIVTNTTVSQLTSWSEVSYIPVSRFTYYNSTIGRVTSTITQYNTEFPVGRFTAVQKTVEIAPGRNTTLGAYTGYIKLTSKLTTRSTSWVTDSDRYTTRNTAWLTNKITNAFNTSSYTCHGGSF